MLVNYVVFEYWHFLCTVVFVRTQVEWGKGRNMYKDLKSCFSARDITHQLHPYKAVRGQVILGKKMLCHPGILPVPLHSLFWHGASSSVHCETIDPKLFTSSVLGTTILPGSCWKLNLWRRCLSSLILRTRNKSTVLISSMRSDELNVNTFMKELPTVYLQYLGWFIFLIVILVLPVLLELLDFPRNFSAVAIKVLTLDLLNFYIV